MRSSHKTTDREVPGRYGLRLHLLALVTAVWAAAVAGPTVDACGPWLPDTLVDEPDKAILAAPLADFEFEIRRLELPEQAELEVGAVPHRPGDGYDHTASAAVDDLAAALKEKGLPDQDAETLIKAYRDLRQQMVERGRQIFWWKQAGDPNRPRPPRLEAKVPEGLPPEFDLYVRGALAYHDGNMAEARSRWQSLLDQPAEVRPRRTVWAAYMIGKSWMDEDPDQAVAWFKRTRVLVREGFADTLYLAASSLGWEARVEYLRGSYERAIHLYLAQHAMDTSSVATSLHRVAASAAAEGFSSGVQASVAISLHRVAAKAFKADEERLAELAADPLARDVLTAYLVSDGGMRGVDPADGVAERVRSLWLRANEQAAKGRVEGADRLAWAAYQIGEFEAAKRWCEQAAPDSPMTKWIQSKLLLRAGKLEEATRLLAEASRLFPEEEEWRRAQVWTYAWYMGQNRPVHRVRGELGVLLLGRGQYVEALDTLLKAQVYWSDAAFVAERVLSMDELIAFVEERWPGDAPMSKPSSARVFWGAVPGGDDAVWELRWLLARRLARAERWEDALRYMPKQLQPSLRKYADSLRAGRDTSLSYPKRAAGYWTAARIAAHQGMDLLGTELDPDWTVHEGSFDPEALALRRLAVGQTRPAAPTPDERKRIQQHAASSTKRFHYNYIATDLAWEAAELMPDHDEKTAAVLCAAGSWIKNRDPQGADRFYKALVKRCRYTEIGERADELKWFPKDVPEPESLEE